MTEDGAAAGLALREADEDFWLAAQFVPAELRDRLTALFLLRCEIARVPDLVNEPAIGEMRLQWWREAIAAVPQGHAPKGQPALAAAARARLFEHLPADAFDAAIDARSRLLYEPYFASADQFALWLRAAEGSLWVAALRCAGASPQGGVSGSVEAAGALFALARESRHRLVHAEMPIDAAYDALAEEARPALAALPDAARAALLTVALAPLYRRNARPTGLARRWRLFRATVLGAFLD